jgi:predicted nucleic acid-binding protein
LSTFIIDASVVIKWVIDEPGTDRALRLRRHWLLAPDLLIAECSHILWKKVRRQELKAEEAIITARLLSQSGIEFQPMLPLFEIATRLAVTLHHPAYDCCYLALAETSGFPFVTADEVVCRKAQSPIMPFSVVALREAA